MATVNPIIYKQLSPRVVTDHYVSPIDIESLGYWRLFEMVRHTASTQEQINCHVSADCNSMSFDHVFIHVPYRLAISHSKSRGGDNFRVQIAPRCLSETIIDISYLPGPMSQIESSQWPSKLGWWMKITDRNFDALALDEKNLKTQTIIDCFLKNIFPGLTFKTGEYDLNPILLGCTEPARPAGYYHPNAFKLLSKIVKWFITIE